MELEVSETPQDTLEVWISNVGLHPIIRASIMSLLAERDALMDEMKHNDPASYSSMVQWREKCYEARAEVERLRADPAGMAYAEQRILKAESRAEKAEAALRVHSAEMLRVEREWADRLSSMGEIIKRVAAQPCEQFTDGVRNCENTGSAPCLPCSARAALRDIDRKRMPGR